MTLTEILLSVLGGSSIGVITTQLTNIGERIGFKPFNCVVCLSIWSALGIAIGYVSGFPVAMTLLSVSMMASVISYFITIQIYK